MLTKLTKSIKFERYFATSKEKIVKILGDSLKPTHLHVEDTSGGCGSFFQIYVASEQFEGKSMIQQHKIVQSLLKDEFSQMHGHTLVTKTPKQVKPEDE